MRRAGIGLVLVAALAAGAVFGWPWIRDQLRPPARNAFVNETADHKHDRALRSSARWFTERTGINLGIVIVRELPRLSTIESRADELFTELRLGRRSDGKALLFLWAEKERRFKIEVSYDLEGVFPDALCRRLEEGARTFMLNTSPFARRDFIVELNVTMMLHYTEYARVGTRSAMPLFPDAGKRYVGGYLSGGAGYVGSGYSAAVEQVKLELKPLDKGLHDAMLPSMVPEETVERYLQSLELGIGEPQLPLLTEASSYFRMDKPHAPGYLQRIRAYISKGLPYRIKEQGDLAVVNFRPGTPVLPIFLRRDERRLWRVDEPKVWASVSLYQDGSSQLKYMSSPYAFGVEARPGQPLWAVFGDKAVPPPLLAMPTRLTERLRRAESAVKARPGDAEAWKTLADLLHFEIFWLQATETVYEKIVQLEPGNEAMLWRLLDIYQMTSDVDGQNRVWCRLLRDFPDSGTTLHGYRWFRKSFYKEDPKTYACRDRVGKVIE